MKLRLTILLIAAAVLLSGIQLFAHHSFAATYFEDKQQTIEGYLVQFMFRNPHSYIQVENKNEKGEIVRWAIEWGGGGQLGRQGVSRDTLKVGDHVVSVGNGRTARIGRKCGSRVVRPDGSRRARRPM